MNYEILHPSGARTNFESWNSFSNSYNSKSYEPKSFPPKKLVASVIREFEQFCREYHVDFSKYKFVEPFEIEGDWRQFTFIDSITEKWPAKIAVHSIISNENGKIFQRVIDFGG